MSSSQGWQSRQGAPPGPQTGGFTEEQAKKVLAGRGSDIADLALDLARRLSELKPAQIRNFYGPLTRLRASTEDVARKLDRLHLMRPRLAYMAARESKAKPLELAFDVLIRNARAEAGQIDSILDFAEAVVGYHRETSGGRQ